MPTIIGSYQSVSYVNAPTITSPTASGKFYGNAPLVVSVGDFSVTNGMDTQSKLTVMISTDINGNNVVLSKVSNGAVNSVTFDAQTLTQNLTGNTTYYISAKYTGTYLGDSAKSSAVNLMFIAASGVVTQSSRTVYRHESDEGSVIKFDHFGATWEVLWLDAKYRTSAKLANSSKDTANPNINVIGYISNSGSRIGATAPIGVVTDATLQSRFSGWSADLVMQKLCDNYVSSYTLTEVPAIKYCRELQVPGFVNGFDVPDIYSLSVGFIEGTTLDELDLTAAANPTKAMSTLYNSQGHGYINDTATLWSSTERDSVQGMPVYIDSGAGYNYKTNVYGVCPTRLIGITTPSGRRVYRHSSDQGSVIEFDHFGTRKRVFWADAVYRTKLQFGAYGKESTNPNITQKYNDNSTGNNWFISSTRGQRLGTTEVIGIITDAELQEVFPTWVNDLPMRKLCNTWMTYEGTTDSYGISGVPAVRHCRNTLTSVFTDGCDLPDIYTQCVALIEGEYIDSLDPTAAANPTKAMSALYNTQGHLRIDGGNGCWSSTESSSLHCLYLHYYGGIDTNDTKRNVYGVCPAREITT